MCTVSPLQGVWLRIRSTKKTQYSKTQVREIYDFFGDSYNYQRGITRILKDDMENLDSYLF